MRRLLVAGTAAAYLAVAACTPAADEPDDPAPAAAPAKKLSVTCTPEGIEVSGTALEATPAGAAIEVSRTTPGRTYLDVSGSDGGGGGDPLPASPTTWMLGSPPGEITLTCALRGVSDEASTATVELSDPGHYWRATTLAEAGCPRDIEPYWAWTASGDTPRAAVDDLVDQMRKSQQHVSAARAEIGYVDAPSETWLVQRNGRTYMSVSVHPARSGGGYTAYPGYRC